MELDAIAKKNPAAEVPIKKEKQQRKLLETRSLLARSWWTP